MVKNKLAELYTVGKNTLRLLAVSLEKYILTIRSLGSNYWLTPHSRNLDSFTVKKRNQKRPNVTSHTDYILFHCFIWLTLHSPFAQLGSFR